MTVWYREPESICAMDSLYNLNIYVTYEKQIVPYYLSYEDPTPMYRGFNDARRVRAKLGLPKRKRRLP